MIFKYKWPPGQSVWSQFKMAWLQKGALFEQRPSPGTKHYLRITIGVRIQELTIIDEHYYCIVVPIILVSACVSTRTLVQTHRLGHSCVTACMTGFASLTDSLGCSRDQQERSTDHFIASILILAIKIRNLEDENSNFRQRNFQVFIYVILFVSFCNLRGYCTPGQFLDCFCIFLKNYNTLVTSKICFL